MSMQRFCLTILGLSIFSTLAVAGERDDQGCIDRCYGEPTCLEACAAGAAHHECVLSCINSGDSPGCMQACNLLDEPELKAVHEHCSELCSENCESMSCISVCVEGCFAPFLQWP